jgi:hypothetical protein
MYLALFFFVGMVAELVLSRLAPRALARLAWLPVDAPQCISLPPRAAAALARPRQRMDGGYRTAPALDYDVSCLPGVRSVTTEQGVFLYAPEHGVAVARPVWSMDRSARPLVRVTMDAEGDHIVLRARTFPLGIVGIAAGAVAGALGIGPGPLVVRLQLAAALLLVGAAMASLTYLLALPKARALFRAVHAEIAARVRMLDSGVPPLPDHAAGSR